MPLTLILGPANSAKAGEVLGAYADAARRDAILVVPTAADVGHYVRELARQGSVFGSVLTFAGLADEIATRTGYAARRITGLQRDRLLRRVVRGRELAAFAESAAAPGFAAAAGELIAELERSLVTPQRFSSALAAWAQSDPRRGPVADDLAGLYRGYAAELDRRGRVDVELFAWRALDALRAEPGRWGSTPVFFYGFDDLSGIERDALETLARVAGADVVASLTYEPARPAMSARAGVAEELRAIAATVRELPPNDEHYAPGARGALHRLERQLFEPAVTPADPGEPVQLLEAGGGRAEAELLAAEVLALLSAGTPANEIVIVSRSPAAAAPLLELVFGRYGVVLDADRRVPLSHTPLGRSVLALARCAFDEAAGAAELLAYLRTPGRLERPEVADGLEADLRRAGLLTAAEAREKLGWRLDEIDDLRRAADPAKELIRDASRLLAAPHRRAAAVLDDREREDARALRAIAAAVTEVEELGERLSGSELIELLERLEVGVTPARGEGVLLSDPLGIRARRFRVVIVCGLCEGEFPLAGRGEPFLPDERRRELAIASGLRLAPREDALALERYLFYSAVSRATERVLISFRSSDEEGNLVLPSPFVGELVDLFGEEWWQRRRRRLLADVTWSPADAPTGRELERAQAAAGPRAPAPPTVRTLGDAAASHIRHREVVSGGALESFAQCPVKWLVERQLDPQRFEPDPDPLTRGGHMHEVLERVLRRLGRAITPATLGEAHERLTEVLAELPGDGEEEMPVLGPGRPEALRAAMRRSIEADLRRYLDHEARDGLDWEPRALEQRFGFEEDSLPPLILGDGAVTLRGVIDRVDVDPTARKAVVRDYKSGGVRPEYPAARWHKERQIQVALYMLVVRELLALEPVAGVYQPLSGRDLRARGVFRDGEPMGDRLVAQDARDPERLAELLEGAEALALELAAGLRCGELEPRPSTCSRDGCRYPGICWSE